MGLNNRISDVSMYLHPHLVRKTSIIRAKLRAVAETGWQVKVLVEVRPCRGNSWQRPEATGL